MKLSELALTTGDIAFGIPNSKKRKKEDKKDKDYKNDPVSGQPKKGKKKAGHVLLSDENPIEETKKPKKSKKDPKEAKLDQFYLDLREVSKAIGDRSLDPNNPQDQAMAHKFAFTLYRLGRIFDTYSRYVVEYDKLRRLNKNYSVVFVEPTFYDRTGYGLIKPKGADEGRLKRLVESIWFTTLVIYTNWAKLVLEMTDDIKENPKYLDVILNAGRRDEPEREKSLDEIYRAVIFKMNEKLAPHRKMGPPKMGKSKGPSGLSHKIGTGHQAQAYADIGLKVGDDGKVTRIKPQGRRIDPKDLGT